MQDLLKDDRQKADTPLPDMLTVGDRRIEQGNGNKQMIPKAPSVSSPKDSWRILLVELVHLVGLFLTHARHARRARVTAVIFDQIVRRLSILDKMPGHDQGLIIRRIGHAATTDISTPDYFMLFGDLAFRGSEAFSRDGTEHKAFAQLSKSLEQAFACFNEHGIYALYLQIPPNTAEREDKIDQLQLALNIVARFHRAVENNSSITFRYFGRALTLSLIHDTNGRPDPNLTVLAGLNGLSSVNMRKLIHQADAFLKMSQAEGVAEAHLDNFNSIFRLRSLRSQLIRPLVEINNLPWIPMEAPTKAAEILFEQIHSAQPSPDPATPLQLNTRTNGPMTEEDVVTAVFKQYYSGLDGAGLGHLLGTLSRMLRAIEKQSGGPFSIERVLGFLHTRLEQLPEALMDQLVMRRQGVKITHQDRSILIGMVHPRLLDVITLIKEHASTRKKTEAVDACPLDSADNPATLSEHFHLTAKDAQTLLEILKTCTDQEGGFDRALFLRHMNILADYGNTAFEVLWCITRRRSQDEARLNMINVLAVLAMRIENLKPSLNFLLSDLLRTPDTFQSGDREAFMLACYMLRTDKVECQIDAEGTPETVLALRKVFNEGLKRHAACRLDIEQARILSKFETVRNAVRAVLQETSTTVHYATPDLQRLLSLEREGMMFMALAGGETARFVMRGALTFYGDPDASIYRCRIQSIALAALMGHLRIVLKAIAGLGQPRDLEGLKRLEQSTSRFMAMDTDPAHKRRVNQTLQWVAPAIRSIQVQWKKI